MLTVEEISKVIGPVLVLHNKASATKVSIDEILRLRSTLAVCGFRESESLTCIRRFLMKRLRWPGIKRDRQELKIGAAGNTLLELLLRNGKTLSRKELFSMYGVRVADMIDSLMNYYYGERTRTIKEKPKNPRRSLDL